MSLKFLFGLDDSERTYQRSETWERCWNRPTFNFTFFMPHRRVPFFIRGALHSQR